MRAFITLAALQLICSNNSLINADQPHLFAEGIVSTQDDEGGGSLSPDGKFFFYTKKSPSTGRNSVSVVCFSMFDGKQWSKPAVAPFSGTWRDLNPHFSPDGSSLYFISDRPAGAGKKNNADIWMVKRLSPGWSEPVHLDTSINSNSVEQSVSLSKNGRLYFSSFRDGKSLKIYSSTKVNGAYSEPELLDTVINSDYHQMDVCIAPDESYILFTSIGRQDAILPKQGTAYPRSDLYISYNENGKWTKPRILSPPFNSEADDSNPFVTADGSTLFFTSKRSFVSQPMPGKLKYDDFVNHLHSTSNGFGNIYTIGTSALIQFQ